MKISIIITTFNASEYVLQSLNSIIAQTYSDFEIVIVDDGSTDDTVSLIRNYMARFPTIKTKLFPIDHIGRAKALNYGVTNATYDWIAILDADDLWHVKKLEMQVKLIQQKQLDFLAAKSKLFYNVAEVSVQEEIEPTADVLNISLDKMLYMNVISHSSILFKKSLAKYSLTRKSQIDYELFLRLLSEGVKLFWLNQTLVYHRIHPGQSFESKKPIRYALNATALQLKYCFKHLKLKQACYVTVKLGYYAFLPRRMRFMLREWYQSRSAFNNFLSNQ